MNNELWRSKDIRPPSSWNRHMTFNQSIKTCDAQASLGYPDRCLRCDGCSLTPVLCNVEQWWHRLTIHSLMLSFHDLRSLPLRCLPSMEPCSRIFGSVSWWQTWPNHDKLRRLTVDSRRSRDPARINTCCQTHSFVLCSLYDSYASFCSICFLRHGFAFPDQSSTSSFTSIEKHRQDKCPKECSLCGKTDGHVMAESACASLIFTSFTVGVDFDAVFGRRFLQSWASCCNSSSLLPSRLMSLSSAKRKLQSGRPPMDTDDSGLSVSSASSTASSAKQSFQRQVSEPSAWSPGIY